MRQEGHRACAASLDHGLHVTFRPNFQHVFRSGHPASGTRLIRYLRKVVLEVGDCLLRNEQGDLSAVRSIEPDDDGIAAVDPLSTDETGNGQYDRLHVV